MILLSSIIQRFEAEFKAQYQSQLLPSQLKALSAMAQCRTSASPQMLAQCEDCHHRRLVPHSCGHRHCPHCQHHESQQWLERQLQNRVPATYFLVTFTLPQELRDLAFQHQRVFYSAMIQCAWQTLATFTHQDKQLQGGTPGAIAVLHTHSRRLDYHPHVHFVVPAAAIDQRNRLWKRKQGKHKRHYLFSHKALAKVFRAKLLEAVTQAGLPLPAQDKKPWVVDCKCVGSGEKALVYLGRYLYRGVIQEKDILACENGQVTFRYQEAKTKRFKTRTLPGPQFLWLLLRHVLPKGFRRARHFGFLHPNCKRWVVLIHYRLDFNPISLKPKAKPRPPLVCPLCGAKMEIIATRLFGADSGPPGMKPSVVEAMQGAPMA